MAVFVAGGVIGLATWKGLRGPATQESGVSLLKGPQAFSSADESEGGAVLRRRTPSEKRSLAIRVEEVLEDSSLSENQVAVRLLAMVGEADSDSKAREEGLRHALLLADDATWRAHALPLALEYPWESEALITLWIDDLATRSEEIQLPSLALLMEREAFRDECEMSLKVGLGEDALEDGASSAQWQRAVSHHLEKERGSRSSTSSSQR